MQTRRKLLDGHNNNIIIACVFSPYHPLPTGNGVYSSRAGAARGVKTTSSGGVDGVAAAAASSRRDAAGPRDFRSASDRKKRKIDRRVRNTVVLLCFRRRLSWKPIRYERGAYTRERAEYTVVGEKKINKTGEKTATIYLTSDGHGRITN